MARSVCFLVETYVGRYFFPYPVTREAMTYENDIAQSRRQALSYKTR